MVGFEISPLEWDTDFFNIKCGKLVILEDSIDWKNLKNRLSEFDFVTVQNPGNNIQVNQLIGENTSAYFVDMNIQFSKKLSRISPPAELRGEECCILNAISITNTEIQNLLVEEDDFKFSKFVCDSRMKQLKGYRVYKEWLKNARGAENKFFTLYYTQKRIGAYILFSITEEICTIELVKVNRENQGQGIASKMIRQIEIFCNERHITALNVGTQVNNIPAINLYHSLGFKEVSRVAVFHLWNK